MPPRKEKMKMGNIKLQVEKELRSYWKDEKMVKHCLKHNKYVKLDDWFVDVCDAKPSISSTMYYSDEYDAPDKNKAQFIHYNESNAPRKMENSMRKYFLIKHYSRQNDEKLASITSYADYENPNDNPNIEIIKELTEKEMQEVNKAIEEVQQDYSKRLETYYKRYADKITTSGYWANR